MAYQHMDANLSVEARVSALIAEMTLDEKIAQLGSFWIYEILDGTTFSSVKAEKLMRNGIGQVTRMGGASNVKPTESVLLANNIQKYLIEHTRLGIPAVIHEECCSGYMAFGATVFPQAIGVASMWEPKLVEEMADVIRRQMRSVGAHHALSPVLDVTRDARWGRVEETFGEDPYLVARTGVAYIRGLQGERLDNGVVSTGKHFVGYGASEGGMNWAPPHLPWREMRDVYLFPFEAAVRDGKMASIMNGYHELDGVPCGSSKELLTTILRDEWGFDGTVVSDYFAITMLDEYHHVAANKQEAAFTALDAGLDVELPFTDSYGNPLREAVLAGNIPESLVDQSLRRVLTQKFALGIFDHPFVDDVAVVFDTPDERKLARELAQKSIVLLKNEGHLLPLSKELGSIAVIGPNADSIRNLFGDYSYPAHVETLLELNNKKNVFNQPLPEGIHAVDDFIPAVSVLAGIKAQLSTTTQIHYAKGCAVNDASTDGFAEAVEAARQAEVAIVVVGDKGGLSDDCTSGEARDRAELQLPGVQSQLVKAIYDTGTPIVLVMINGRPVSLGWIAESVASIVEAWFPSEEGGNAVADVLFGDVNPGGKLPITFPRSVGQVPIFYGHKPSGGRSHWKGDYVETSSKPLYPFGFGLSYTQFELNNLRTDSLTAPIGGEINIQVDVTNIGERTGDEVVQLYTRQNATSVTRPVKELKGFQRVTIEPHQTKTVSFCLKVNQLGFYDQAQQLVIEPGKIEIMVGNSSQDIACAGEFEILGAKTEIHASKVFFSDSQVS